MFKNNLFSILLELKQHQNNDRAKLIEFYINKRLNESLSSYYDKLNRSVNYLSDKNSLGLLKKINREGED